MKQSLPSGAVAGIVVFVVVVISALGYKLFLSSPGGETSNFSANAKQYREMQQKEKSDPQFMNAMRQKMAAQSQPMSRRRGYPGSPGYPGGYPGRS